MNENHDVSYPDRLLFASNRKDPIMTKQYENGPKEFPFGYTPLAERDGKHSQMLMDFGVLRLRKGETHEDHSPQDERAYLLVYGEVTLEWDGQSQTIARDNCFDVPPYVLHVPKGVDVKITGVAADSEINISATENNKDFASKLYLPTDTPDEYRGKGTMQETSTRIVRTVFDYSSAPYSNLVVGEVIGFPGKWSSYPPHHHPQPEIYYYKFNPENGFGFADLGSEVAKLEQNGAAFITEGHVHPHATAPGYAIWYIWIIRHLEGNPYITPTFLPEHLWVTDEKATFWPDKKEGK